MWEFVARSQLDRSTDHRKPGRRAHPRTLPARSRRDASVSGRERPCLRDPGAGRHRHPRAVTGRERSDDSGAEHRPHRGPLALRRGQAPRGRGCPRPPGHGPSRLPDARLGWPRRARPRRDQGVRCRPVPNRPAGVGAARRAARPASRRAAARRSLRSARSWTTPSSAGSPTTSAPMPSSPTARASGLSRRVGATGSDRRSAAREISSRGGTPGPRQSLSVVRGRGKRRETMASAPSGTTSDADGSMVEQVLQVGEGLDLVGFGGRRRGGRRRRICGRWGVPLVRRGSARSVR